MICNEVAVKLTALPSVTLLQTDDSMAIEKIYIGNQLQ